MKIAILINWASITNYFMDFSVILFPVKLTRNRIYPAPAAQRLMLAQDYYNRRWLFPALCKPAVGCCRLRQTGQLRHPVIPQKSDFQQLLHQYSLQSLIIISSVNELSVLLYSSWSQAIGSWESLTHETHISDCWSNLTKHGGQLFSNLADLCHVLYFPCLRAEM